MNNVKIKSDNGKTQVFINDYKLENVNGIRFEQDVDTFPGIEIAMRELPDFEVDGVDIRFSITPYSVVSALNVIRTAFSAGHVLSEEILDSVCYLLAEITEKEPNCCALVKKGEILTGRISKEKVDDENHNMRTFVINTYD